MLTSKKAALACRAAYSRSRCSIVPFALIATELMRRSQMSRHANKRHRARHCRQCHRSRERKAIHRGRCTSSSAFLSLAWATFFARLMGQWLSERLGRPFIIENRPGAGSALAAEAVVRAAPDDYTLPWVSTANPIRTTLYDNLSFDFIRDIAPVASIAQVPLVLEVNPSLPANIFPNSSPLPNPTRARSTGRPAATKR